MPALVATRRVLLAAPFSPLALPRLALWLDASDPATLYQESTLATPAASDGDPVGGWKDKSGNTRNVLQATSTKRPTLKLALTNGKSALRFDGTDDFLQAANFTLVQPCTLIVVASMVVAAAANKTLFMGRQSDCEIGVNASNRYTLYAGTTLGNVAGNALGTGTFHVLTAIANGASSETRFDRTSTATGNAGTFNPGGCTVGAFSDGAQQFANADIAEGIMCAAILSPADLGRVEDYLKAKWGSP